MNLHTEKTLGQQDPALVMDQLPMDITMIDMRKYKVYYNKFSTRLADRRGEYIGKDIRICHKHESSINFIN